MSTTVFLNRQPDLYKKLLSEFLDSPVGCKVANQDDKIIRVYFERWMHIRAREFGPGVYYQKSGTPKGSLIFPDDNEYIIFKLSYA